MGKKRISSGGSPRGPKPGRIKKTAKKRIAQSQEPLEFTPPQEFPETQAIVKRLVPGWDLADEAQKLWDVLIPTLEDSGTATPVDAVPLASLVSGLALEKICIEHLLSGGIGTLCEIGESGNAYQSPVVNVYLGVRKSNQAALAEAGITRIRRGGASSEDRLVTALMAERETKVSEKLRFSIEQDLGSHAGNET